MKAPGVRPKVGADHYIYNPNRRRFLHAAFGAAGAATLMPLFAPGKASAAVGSGEVKPHELKFITPDGKDPGTKMVVIFMQGGISNFEMFDPKTSPKIRGPFKQIRDGNGSPLPMTELLRPLARHYDKLIPINNLSSSEGDHDKGAGIVLTTSSKMEDGSFYADSIYTNPFIEFSRMLSDQASSDVGYVVLHQSKLDNDGRGRLWDKPWGSIKHNDPETVYSAYDLKSGQFANPFASGTKIPISRFRERMQLLEMMQQSGHSLIGESVDKKDRAYRKANSLIDGDFNHSFDLSKESAALYRYGDTQVGKQFLLARRMLERGARVVVVNDGNYDNHANIEKDMGKMVPRFAKGLAAFMDDIEKMDEEVVILMATEFGRTPKINLGAGRDHWPGAFGMLIGGNNIKGGRVIGKTDDDGKIVGDAFDSSLVGETALNLMGLGRFEKRGEFTTDIRFPFIDIEKEKVISSSS